MRRVHPRQHRSATLLRHDDEQTQKGQRLHSGQETISILDMFSPEKWATASFDVLIVCEIYTIEIEAYWWNKSLGDREEMEMVEKTQRIKDVDEESATVIQIQAEK